jgi:hypothetical protein
VTGFRLSTELETGSTGDPVKALFRAVLALALKDADAIEWLRSEDGQLVTELADVDRDWVLRVIAKR